MLVEYLLRDYQAGDSMIKSFLFLFFMGMAFSISASAMGTITLIILPHAHEINNNTNWSALTVSEIQYAYQLHRNKTITNITEYLNKLQAEIRANETANGTYVAPNITVPNKSYFEPLNSTIIKPVQGEPRNASQCQTSYNKDWEYYRLSLYAMGFEVSGQTKEFKDMIIGNMGINSYYHRCLAGY